ncbi:MAG: TonB-dependent receptor [Bacteroidales bacterium]
MVKKIFFILVTLFTVLGLNGIAYAQENKVQGTILDETGQSAIGVYIQNKTINKGTATDLDGKFELLANLNDVLVISHIGYKGQEIIVKDFNPIALTLVPDMESLEEIIVIGYGTQKKSDVSGSVTKVSGEKLAQMSRSGAAESLQGVAPGLNVNYGSGAPGDQPSLQVRGLTSWGSSNAPLVIIDGVPGDITYLNPEDIKSMTVLKDAATAAIYGSRAAAGVILIETKRGGKQEPKITASVYVGMDDMPKRMELCNSAEFVSVRKAGLINAGVPNSKWPKYIAAFEKDPSQFADTDWQDEYFRRGITQKYDVGYVAGNETMNIAFSGYYSSTEGVVVGTDSRKYGFRLNSDVVRGKFKVGESVSVSFMETTPEENSGFPGMFQVTNIEPLVSVYNEKNEGGYGGAIPGMGMSDAGNPVAFNNLIDTKIKNNNVAASAYVQYQPIKDLTIKFQGGTNIDYYHYKSFSPTYYIGSLKVNKIASLYEQRSKTVATLLELTANYNKTFGEKHNFQAMLGISQEENKYDDQSGSAKQFENNELPWLSHGQTGFAVKGGFNRYGLRSAFARVNYNYDYRYLFMVSARYDGSSRFAAGNKWGFFPSASVGWNIANEKFWKEIKETVSTFKLRLSYGALGNQSIGNYKYIPVLSSNTNNLNYPLNGNAVNMGYGIGSLPSANIKWETTLYSNIGVDLGFWNNKLEVSAEGYIKNTVDMLSEKNISACTGFGSLIVNDGKLRTTGFEIQAIYHGTAGKKFRYDIDLNLSHFKSVLKEMADPGYLSESGPARSYVGGEIGEFWVTKTAGIFQNQGEIDEWNKNNGYKDENGDWVAMQNLAKPGDIRFIDQNGDGKLDSGDKVKVGSGMPKVVMGLNVNLAYGAFDLVANFYGNFGVKRYNYTKFQLERMDHVFNYGKNALNAWTPEKPNTDIPRAVLGDPNGNTIISDRFVEDGSYLTLNNLQIGYNLPSSICKKIRIDNCRIYLAATRLFTITGYDGYDPSTGNTYNSTSDGPNFMGVDYAIYPLSRTYMIGVKFGF